MVNSKTSFGGICFFPSMEQEANPGHDWLENDLSNYMSMFLLSVYIILLMEEIPSNHLRCKKPYIYMLAVENWHPKINQPETR